MSKDLRNGDIRRLYSTGNYTQEALAKMFEVDRSQISRIVNERPANENSLNVSGVSDELLEAVASFVAGKSYAIENEKTTEIERVVIFHDPNKKSVDTEGLSLEAKSIAEMVFNSYLNRRQ